MSDAAQTQNSQPNTETPSTSPAPRGLWSSGLKLEQAEGVPPEYVGKSAQELVQIAETYKQAMASPGHYQPQPQYQPPSQAAFSSPQPPDPSLIYSNPQAYHQQMEAYNDWKLEQRLSQYAAPLMGNQAATAKWQSQNDPEFGEVWRKHGHKIEAMASRIPAHQLNVEAYNMIAKMVRGEHYTDYVEDRAKALVASGGFGTERAAPNAGMPNAPVSALDRLFDPKSEHPQSVRYRTNNTSRNDFLKYCGAMGKDPEAHANEILGGSVLAA